MARIAVPVVTPGCPLCGFVHASFWWWRRRWFVGPVMGCMHCKQCAASYRVPKDQITWPNDRIYCGDESELLNEVPS